MRHNDAQLQTRSAQNYLIGSAAKRSFRRRDHIESGRAEPLDDARVNILVCQQRKRVQVLGAISAVSTTSFRNESAA